jgi:hypothetical protein
MIVGFQENNNLYGIICTGGGSCPLQGFTVVGSADLTPGASSFYYGCYNCTDTTVEYLFYSIQGVSGSASDFADVSTLRAANSK